MMFRYEFCSLLYGLLIDYFCSFRKPLTVASQVSGTRMKWTMIFKLLPVINTKCNVLLEPRFLSQKGMGGATQVSSK